MFGFSSKKKPQKHTNAGSESEKWKNELSISLTIKREIKPLEDVVVNCACELQRKQSVDAEIDILQKLIKHYLEIRRKCYLLGPDYIEYFNRMWETAREHKEDGPSYVARYQKRLQYINEHYRELKETERQYQQQAGNLDRRLVSYLRENCPVLQSDIYKSFGPTVKEDIRDLLYHMEQSGKIKRVKSGRSYIVTLK